MMLAIAFLLNHTQNLYPGNLYFLETLRPPTLLIILRAFNAVFTEDVDFLLQHRLDVDWLSNKRTFLRSNPINFLTSAPGLFWGKNHVGFPLPFGSGLIPQQMTMMSHRRHPHRTSER